MQPFSAVQYERAVTLTHSFYYQAFTAVQLGRVVTLTYSISKRSLLFSWRELLL